MRSHRISIKQIRRVIEAFTCSSTISPDDVERKAFRTRSQIRRSVTARNPFQVEKIPKSICAGGKVIYGNDELSYTQSDGNFFPYPLSMAQDIPDIYLPGPMLKKIEKEKRKSENEIYLVAT